MPRTRIIPTLLLKEGGLVKTQKFAKERYVGDPINAMRIFNQKEVDELVLLDICASKTKSEPAFDEIREIVSEAFMPIGYGGGINTMAHIEKLFTIGIEKVILNTGAFTNENLIKEASGVFGSQSIVVSIDVKKDLWGDHKIFTCSGTIKQKISLDTAIKKIQDLGAGELIINSIDRDGTMAGYDNNLITKVSSKLDIPVIALGGAGNIQDFVGAIRAGASGVSAGSLFIFQGVHRAVLISYINSEQVEKASAL